MSKYVYKGSEFWEQLNAIKWEKRGRWGRTQTIEALEDIHKAGGADFGK